VDFRAVDLMLGRPAPTSPVSSKPGSAAVPPGALPWATPGVCADESWVVSGFPTLMSPICCLLSLVALFYPLLVTEALALTPDALGALP
jgi:hypothetical protein